MPPSNKKQICCTKKLLSFLFHAHFCRTHNVRSSFVCRGPVYLSPNASSRFKELIELFERKEINLVERRYLNHSLIFSFCRFFLSTCLWIELFTFVRYSRCCGALTMFLHNKPVVLMGRKNPSYVCFNSRAFSFTVFRTRVRLDGEIFSIFHSHLFQLLILEIQQF